MTTERVAGHAESWWADLADAVTRLLTEPLDDVRVEAVRVIPDAVEVVFRQPPHWRLRGLRLTAADIDSSDLLAGRAPDEVAAILIDLGIHEPKADGEFALPDADGIRWIRDLRYWLA